MGRMYSAEFENVSVSAAQDLFSLLPAANKPVIIHAFYLAQISDVGDAAEEILRVAIVQGNTTVGSGGTALTAEPLNSDDAADAATVRSNDTTEVSAGTPVTLHSDAFNIRVGWVYMPTPEMRITTKNAEHIALQLLAAPADAVTMSGTIVFEEI